MKWIDIKEKLPQEKVPVLVHFKHIGLQVARLYLGDLTNEWEWRLNIKICVFALNEVTHWMELPDYPAICMRCYLDITKEIKGSKMCLDCYKGEQEFVSDLGSRIKVVEEENEEDLDRY